MAHVHWRAELAAQRCRGTGCSVDQAAAIVVLVTAYTTMQEVPLVRGLSIKCVFATDGMDSTKQVGCVATLVMDDRADCTSAM
jgi:hypothetical protein